MMKEALSYFPLKSLPLFGLALFLMTFIGVMLWAYRKGSDEVYEQASQLPLDLSIQKEEQKGVSHE